MYKKQPTDIAPIDQAVLTQLIRQVGMGDTDTDDETLTPEQRNERDYQVYLQRRESRPWFHRLKALNGGDTPTKEQIVAPDTTLVPFPAPSCLTCGGIGWLHFNVPLGHPSFGKSIRCACKVAADADRKIAHIQRISELPEEMASQTFTSFRRNIPATFFGGNYPDGLMENNRFKPELLARHNAKLDEAYLAALAFVTLRDAPPWLLFEGDPGSGKTHLMAAIANTLMERHVVTMFRVVPALLDWFKAGFNDKVDDFQDRFTEVCKVDVLLLDDLGAEKSTAWSDEKLFQLINYRYQRKLRTVFSTNVQFDSLEDRIRSRLKHAALCKRVITTPIDYRPYDQAVQP